MEAPGHDDPGYDDWFDEPDAPTETQSGANRGVYEEPAEEVWVLPEEEGSGSGGQRTFEIAGRTLTTTQVAIIGLSVLAIIIAILAAAGVFNGTKAAVPPVTTPTHPITTVQNTTPTNTAPSVQAPTQTPLQSGDTGPQVKQLQKALAAVGYSPGAADGDYGPSTMNAVERFQIAKGLGQDGVYGPATAAALQKALNG
jgi:peptidoglycan hydrolase-like protein with peptidoglycan-binding domain